MKKNRKKIGFFLYLLLVIFSVFYLYRVKFGVFNLSLDRAVYIALVIYTVFCFILRRISISFRQSSIFVVVFFDMLISIVDFLRSAGDSFVEKDIISHVVSMSIVLISVLYLDSEYRFSKACRFFLYSSIIASGITIFTYFFGHMPFSDYVVNLPGSNVSLNNIPARFLGVYRRAVAAFYDPSFYGLFLCISIAIGIYLYQFVERRRWVVAVTVLNFIMLLATMSRTSWVGFSVILFVAFIYISRLRKKLILLFFIGFLGLTTSISDMAFNNGSSPSVLEDASSLKSLKGRQEHWHDGIEVFLSDPLLGGGSAMLADKTGDQPTAHLVYLSWLAKYGILGFIFYFWFIFYPLIYASFKRGLRRQYRFLIVSIFGSMAIMYIGYDYFNQLNIEYLAFGIVYAAIFNNLGLCDRISTTQVNSA